MHLNCQQENCEHAHPSTLQIILLVLIILGIGLLATTKFWVPKLVAFIMLHS